MKHPKKQIEAKAVVVSDKEKEAKVLEFLRAGIGKEVSAAYENIDETMFMLSTYLTVPVFYYSMMYIMKNMSSRAYGGAVTDKFAALISTMIGTIFIPSIFYNKIIVLFAYNILPIDKLLSRDLLIHNTEMTSLLLKHNDKKFLNKVSYYSYCVVFSMVTAVGVYNFAHFMRSLTNHIVNQSEFDETQFERHSFYFLQLLSIYAAILIKTYSGITPAAQQREMANQLKHFLFNSDYKWMTKSNRDYTLFSTVFNLEAKQAILNINGYQYILSKKKFFSELVMFLSRLGYMVSFNHHEVAIANLQLLSKTQLAFLQAEFQDRLIAQSNIASHKVQKLEQLDSLVNSLNLQGIAWDYYRFTDTKTNLPVIKFIADVSSVDIYEQQLLCEKLEQLYGTDNVILDDGRINVIGWYTPFQYDFNKVINAISKVAVVETTPATPQQTTQTTVSHYQLDSYLSFWSSRKTTSKPITKTIKVDSEKESKKENNNNNIDSIQNRIDAQYQAVKNRYPDRNVYYHQADWLPKDQVYFTVIDRTRMTDYVENHYKKDTTAKTKLAHCIKLVAQAHGRAIKSNSQRNKTKSHTAGFFHSGREAVNDSKNNIRVSEFKAKTDDNARLFGDVVKKNVQVNNQDVEVSVIKLRSFDPNRH